MDEATSALDNESEGIVAGRDQDRRGLLNNPEVYAPSVSVNQYNNAGHISASHSGSGDVAGTTGGA